MNVQIQLEDIGMVDYALVCNGEDESHFLIKLLVNDKEISALLSIDEIKKAFRKITAR